LWRIKVPVLVITGIDKKPVLVAGTNTQAPLEDIPDVNWKQKDGTIMNYLSPVGLFI